MSRERPFDSQQVPPSATVTPRMFETDQNGFDQRSEEGHPGKEGHGKEDSSKDDLGTEDPGKDDAGNKVKDDAP